MAGDMGAGKDTGVGSSTVSAPRAASWGQSIRRAWAQAFFSVCLFFLFHVSSCDYLFMLQPTLTTGRTASARLGHFRFLFPAMAHAKSLGKAVRKAGSG